MVGIEGARSLDSTVLGRSLDCLCDKGRIVLPLPAPLFHRGRPLSPGNISHQTPEKQMRKCIKVQTFSVSFLHPKPSNEQSVDLWGNKYSNIISIYKQHTSGGTLQHRRNEKRCYLGDSCRPDGDGCSRVNSF